MSNGHQKCQRPHPRNTVFVAIDPANGSMTTLPFTMPGPPGSGQAAW
jgi:hypothetical protein